MRAFRSPQAAQFWFEWHGKGRLVLLSFLAVLGGIWAWLAIAQPNLLAIDDVLGGLGGMCMVLTPFVGLYLGSDAGRFDRGVFSATRPLSDGDMASAVLRNVAAVVGSCSAVWLLGVFVALAVFRPQYGRYGGEWQQIQHIWANGRFSWVCMAVCPTPDLLLRVLWLFLGIWTAVGLSAAFALARSWFVCVGGIGFLGLIVSLLWLANSEVHPLFSLAVVCMSGTVAAYIAAYRLHVIAHRTIVKYGAVYLLLCIVSISAYAMTLPEGRLPVDVQCAGRYLCRAVCPAGGGVVRPLVESTPVSSQDREGNNCPSSLAPVGRGKGEGMERMSVVSFAILSDAGSRLSGGLAEDSGAEIPIAAIGQQGHDRAPRHGAGHLDGAGHGGSTGHPHEQSFTTGQQSRGVKCLLIHDGELLVQPGGIIDAGTNRFAHVLEALDAVAHGRLHTHDPHPRQAFLQVATDAHQRAAGPHAGHEHVDVAVRLGE